MSLYDNNLSEDDKYNLFFSLISNNVENNTLSDHYLYEYINNLTETQIDNVSKLNINKYLFFRYLPNIYYIKKYYVHDSNAFHGITKNDNISKEDRQNIIKELLLNKN